MFPIKDSVPSRSTPVATRALILVNVIVFFFELGLPHQSVEQLFYLFGLVPARFSHPDWALAVGFPVDSFWPILTHQFLHGGWFHIVANMWTLWIFGDNVEDKMGPLRFTIFLLALRHGCWAHSSIRESRLHCAIGRCIWRNRRGIGCLFSLFPDCASAGDVSDLLFSILFRNPGCVLSSSLVFHAIIQRHDGSRWSPTGRWYRLVGTHRGICSRNALVLVVCEKTEPPNAT